MTKEADFHQELQCYAVSVSYDFGKRTGTLVMEGGSCCDMAGCIALFERLDPGVRSISTYAGQARDTSYHRVDGRWTALPAAP